MLKVSRASVPFPIVPSDVHRPVARTSHQPCTSQAGCPPETLDNEWSEDYMDESAKEDSLEDAQVSLDMLHVVVAPVTMMLVARSELNTSI
ncbi:hypothetical protein PMIN02_013123 [Paraphaeosphaeria minitans]